MKTRKEEREIGREGRGEGEERRGKGDERKVVRKERGGRGRHERKKDVKIILK
jgi:hypothetical protein